MMGLWEGHVGRHLAYETVMLVDVPLGTWILQLLLWGE